MTNKKMSSSDTRAVPLVAVVMLLPFILITLAIVSLVDIIASEMDHHRPPNPTPK